MNKAAAFAGTLVLTLIPPMQGIASDVGRDWGVERRSYTDPVTGISISEMTKAGSASDNLYFHFSNFTADNHYLLLVSDKNGSARMVGAGDYWHAAARSDGKFIVLDDAKGHLSLLETATSHTRLLATGLRDGVHAVHPHASFDRQGRYVQFHSGRTHETVALIDLTQLPPTQP